MAFATGFTRTVELPNAGETAVIKKLNWMELKEARKQRASEGIETARQLGGEIFRAIQDSTKQEEIAEKLKKLQEAQDADPNTYAMEVTLAKGVVSFGGFEVDGVKDSKDLDEPTAQCLHAAIVAFARERVTKNG